jgi:hypothetical protein
MPNCYAKQFITIVSCSVRIRSGMMTSERLGVAPIEKKLLVLIETYPTLSHFFYLWVMFFLAGSCLHLWVSSPYLNLFRTKRLCCCMLLSIRYVGPYPETWVTQGVCLVCSRPWILLGAQSGGSTKEFLVLLTEYGQVVVGLVTWLIDLM